jgi:hypothetical protein
VLMTGGGLINGGVLAVTLAWRAAHDNRRSVADARTPTSLSTTGASHISSNSMTFLVTGRTRLPPPAMYTHFVRCSAWHTNQWAAEVCHRLRAQPVFANHLASFCFAN